MELKEVNNYELHEHKLTFLYSIHSNEKRVKMNGKFEHKFEAGTEGERGGGCIEMYSSAGNSEIQILFHMINYGRCSPGLPKETA
jgi:hypothetical protein